MKLRKKYIIIGLIIFIGVLFAGIKIFKSLNFNSNYQVGQIVDSLNHVYVYYNGGVDHVEGRNLGTGGYNIGLKYQCVEFVKRYYYEYFNHKMPDAYGHAKDFFDPQVKDGEINKRRALVQYSNGSKSMPEINDLIIFEGTLSNRYGHVAITSKVTDTYIEIIQQNPGPYGKSREIYGLRYKDGFWFVENDRILGWLRKTEK